MTKTTKPVRLAKGRQSVRATSGMRAELEVFKRERILKEMIELFQERGFRGVTLDALAERLKVTKPFIYQFFDSKQQLIATVYERGAQQLLASIDGYLDNESPAAKRLYDFVRSFALQNIESRAISVVFGQEEGELPPKTLEAIRAIYRAVRHQARVADRTRKQNWRIHSPGAPYSGSGNLRNGAVDSSMVPRWPAECSRDRCTFRGLRPQSCRLPGAALLLIRKFL